MLGEARVCRCFSVGVLNRVHRGEDTLTIPDSSSNRLFLRVGLAVDQTGSVLLRAVSSCGLERKSDHHFS